MKVSITLYSAILYVFVSVMTGQTVVYADATLRPVHATGSAVGEDATAKDLAQLDAQRKAVVEAAGVFIDSQSVVDNYQLVDEHILSRARGYLTEYNVVKTWTDQGLSFCEIRAVVGVDDLKRDWMAALPHLIHRQSEPRCIVIITEDADTTDLVPPKLGGSCTNRIEKLLKNNNLRVMDQRTIDQILDKDTAAAALRGDVEQIAAKAQQFDAELLIFGQAEADPLGAQSVRGIDMYRWEMALNAKIIRLDTADVIVSDSYSQRLPYMAMTSRCGNKGFRELADKQGPKLLRDLTASFQKRFQHRILEVQFQGCSGRSFRQKVLPALSRMPGVRAYNGVNMRSTEHNEVITEVYWAGNLSSFISAVYSLEKKGEMSFKELTSSGARVRFEVAGLE